MTGTVANKAEVFHKHSHHSTAQQWLQLLADNNITPWQQSQHNMNLLLAPLLDSVGWQGDIHSLCDALPRSEHAATHQDILMVMGALGYRIRQEHRTIADLKPEDLPALFLFDQPQGWRRAIVISELNAYGLIWEDGREQFRANIANHRGTLYQFERILPDSTQEQVEARFWLRDFLLRFRGVFWHAAGLSLVMHIFTLAMPLFSMAVYDRVIAAHAPGTLPLLALGVISALLLEKCIRWLRVQLVGWIGARCGLVVTSAMFERLLFLPASVIEQASVSAQLARIRTFESVRDFIASPMFLSLMEMPFTLILILAIALLAGPVAWVSLGTMVVYALLLLLLRPRWQKLGQSAAHSAATRQQLLMEIISNTKPIYAAGLSHKMLQRFRSVSWQAARAQHHFGLTAALVQQLASFLTVVAGIATIHWCLNRIWAGEMSAGAMVATMIITWRVLYPLQTLCSILPHVEQIRASLAQVSQLMSMTPEAHSAQYVLAEREVEGRVSFQNVSLRYSRKTDPVFYGLNAEIPKGQVVAIFGNNGCGKSSILRLMLGLYIPVTGVIRLDNVDHRQFDPRSLRRQIAYLPQVPELLTGTIAENMRMMEPLAPDHKLRQALLWADAWELIEALPAGLNTKIGAGGFTPSGGLAARICLARLYLSTRPLVCCDELPAQILNSATGDRFRQFLNDCRGKRTVFFVTHREDWLELADQVIWMRPDGRPLVGRPGKDVKPSND